VVPRANGICTNNPLNVLVEELLKIAPMNRILWPMVASMPSARLLPEELSMLIIITEILGLYGDLSQALG
jgi:hypothetical protein